MAYSPKKFHLHYPIDFTNLLNLVTALNTTNNKTIKDFVRNLSKRKTQCTR